TVACGADEPCPDGQHCSQGLCTRSRECAAADSRGNAGNPGTSGVSGNEVAGQAGAEGGTGGVGGGCSLSSGGPPFVDPRSEKSADLAYERSIVFVEGCTGLLIERDWVLTGIHCQLKPGQVVTSLRATGSLTRVIDRVEAMPTSQEDAALVHLSQPINDGA